MAKYLDKNGLITLWAKIKTTFGGALSHSETSTTVDIALKDKASTPNTLSSVTIPAATTSKAGAMTASDKSKLNGIASGAEVNVQADWNVTDSTSDAFIKNKPTIPEGVIVDAAMSDTSTNAIQNKAVKAYVDGKEIKIAAGNNVQITEGTGAQAGYKVISATDTTYENKSASQSGTDVSLVTTGEKYTWNNKPSNSVVVHNTGDESISGEKTFTTGIKNSSSSMYGNKQVVIQFGSLSCDTTADQDNHRYHSGMSAASVSISDITDNTTVVLKPSGIGYKDYNSTADPTMVAIPDIKTAVDEAHEHSNQTELDKIASGDKAKWDAKQNAITFNTAYNASTNKAATMSDINSALTGAAKYQGTIASESAFTALTNYKAGYYWVASASFTHTVGSSTITVDSGDMIFANKDSATYAAVDFDIISVDIESIPDSEIEALT